ncbi:MAG: head GIN domain-containing protein [Saprospiraceae bacterium]
MKIIKSITFCLLCFLLLPQSSTAQNWWKNGITGEGPLVEREITMSNFSSVGLSISADVILEHGASQKIVIKGQKNIIENIKTNVKNDAWEIDFKKNAAEFKNVTIYITLPELKNVAVSGSGSLTGKSLFRANKMKVAISGSGDISLNVDTKELYCKISGSGGMELKGKATEQNIAISGSGDISAFDLASETCNISISGSGDCEVKVNTKLKASIAGSGDVTYKGDPSVRSSIAGSGDISSAN